MPDDGSELARTIVQAYRASGVAAKVHGGKVFIEREEGWEGPIEPASARTTYTDDLRAIEDCVRNAAARVIDNLNETERYLLGQGSGYTALFLTDSERFRGLGYDDRTARRYVRVVTGLSLWKEFQP